MRIIVYGDLHGCFEEFKALRAKVKPAAEDREIAIGDILDRGPKSNELLRHLRENGVESIMGNHEYKYLRYKNHQDAFLKTGKKNPMTFDEKRLSIFNALDEKDFEYLRSLPYFIKIDSLTLVHAGILNNIDLETANKKELEKLLWIRYLKDDNVPLALGKEDETSKFWGELYDGKQGFIVYGHEPFKEARLDKHSLGVDTGCAYGDKLSACVVANARNPKDNYEIVQVNSNAERKNGR